MITLSSFRVPPRHDDSQEFRRTGNTGNLSFCKFSDRTCKRLNSCESSYDFRRLKCDGDCNLLHPHAHHKTSRTGDHRTRRGGDRLWAGVGCCQAIAGCEYSLQRFASLRLWVSPVYSLRTWRAHYFEAAALACASCFAETSGFGEASPLSRPIIHRTAISVDFRNRLSVQVELLCPRFV